MSNMSTISFFSLHLVETYPSATDLAIKILCFFSLLERILWWHFFVNGWM